MSDDTDLQDSVTVSRRGQVAVLTVNRPESRNALSRDVQAALRDRLDALAQADDVRAVVLTGAGTKIFAAGADVRELRSYRRSDGLVGNLQRFCDELEQFPKPTIAAVNGFALGGGCEVALSCDIRVASRNARFGFPETGLSIIPGAGGTQRLTRVIGGGRAMEMILTGRRIDADEARSMGLVTTVAEPEQLLDAAHAVAETIAGKGPLATQLARLVVRSSADLDHHSGQLMERLAQAILHETADKQEGIDAMLAKRTPHFEGR